MSSSTALYEKISTALASHKNPERAQLDKRYHKYQFSSLGIQAPLLKTVLTPFKAEIKQLTPQQARTLAQQLYAHNIEEFILAGTFVLQNNRNSLDAHSLDYIDTQLNHFKSWSTIDDFCGDVLIPLLLKYPQEVITLLTAWNTSDNMWKRRASVVAFTRKAGKSGKFTQQALTFCENLINDKHDLIQKAVGWCLKDCLKGDHETVLAYVKELRKRKVPATITLYAIEKLDPAQRAQVLAIK